MNTFGFFFPSSYTIKESEILEIEGKLKNAERDFLESILAIVKRRKR